MSSIITLAIPEAPPRSTASDGALQAKAGTGIRLGLLDNSKPNADLLLKGLLDRVSTSVGFESVLFVSKPNAATYAPREVLDQLEKGADLVISAMGD
ncbi:MAG: hypothetical protein AB7G13_06840 [Lautropia sp.]